MTRHAFVIGQPIAHSRSPLIHRHWLQVYEIAGEYDPIEVTPEGLPDFFARIRAGEFVGGNVTLPHKEQAWALADTHDPASRAIAAANTLVLKAGQIHASNTDHIGFLANLDDRAPGWDENLETAVVLGAGGASRAIIAALSARGARTIRILNRTPARAGALAAEMQDKTAARLSPGGLDDFAGVAPNTDILVNTSTIGMHGTRFEGIDIAALPSHALVTDIVYTPLVTPLLADAAAHGLRIVDGLGMLLHQAVPGFEAWFGTRPEVTPALRALVEKDMGLAG
ncbi:shikimate dehydrogenase [Cucumibacter marinus]|uniref:shikimate dehydrogenase n=1 Tax=Cucumibacter marinus TaxID=1121252 RepID=UPI00041764E5|nr:shikimate dehydrogenase [Cucumibacter marinus]